MPDVPVLSEAIAKRLEELRVVQPIPSTQDLREIVAQHRRRANAIASHDPFVDIAKAHAVADSCLRLLNAIPTLPEGSRKWVRAACLYFADRDDVDDDFDSITGFDDDAQVVNYVAIRVGLSRLCVRQR